MINIFLVLGINKKQPKVSVRKPGVSKKAPAIRIAIHSNIGIKGILFNLTSSIALFSIEIPWLFTKKAPIIPVIIIIKIVFHKPICLPTVINKITSIIGIAIKNKKNMFAY